jgi:hypothetical protein
VQSARTLSKSKVDRPLAWLSALAVGLCSGLASAREPTALHEEPDAEDLADLEEEAWGTRGLVRTRAETVSFDTKARTMDLMGNVRVDSPPFHLRSERISLSRGKFGIEATGPAELAFCPCLGTPLTVRFDKAIVAPPGELFLKSPMLEVYGVPVFYLPWFWLRSADKIGVLPPDIAYRGQDGFYAGGGVHLPWREHGSKRSLDLRAGGYFEGGFVADARLLTADSSTKIRYDRLAGGRAPRLGSTASPAENANDGLFVDARGATHDESTTVAWDADVVRGRRGVAATTDLDAAAKPWDRAAASGAVHVGPFVAETGARAVTRRGGDLVSVEAAGPFAALRTSGAIGSGVTYDVAVEGGSVRVSGTAASLAARQPSSILPDAVSYGRAEIGALAATNVGPLAASVTVRGAGDIAAEGRRDGGDRAATARVRFGVPLARSYGGPERSDPYVHVVDPFVSAAILHASGDAILGSLPGRGLAAVSGTAPVTEVGIASTLGRWGSREAVSVLAAGGAAYGEGVAADSVRPLLRGRFAGTLSWLGTQIDSAHVFGDAGVGSALLGRVRVGPLDGPRAYANAAIRDGIDPVLARALTVSSVEAPAGFLSREGASGGTGLVIPWTHALTTSGGVDLDATNRELVAARGGFELRDRCKCLTLRADAAHRIGRSGVDVWVALDFAADR